MTPLDGPGEPPGHPAWVAIRPWVDRIDHVSMWLIVVAMSAMTIMVSLQVFWRYVLGSSIDSADEVSRLFFVWAIFLAIPHGIKYGTHVGIDLLVLKLPPVRKDQLARLMSMAGAVLMAAVFYSAWIATIDKWPELMPTLAITAGVYYLAVLASAAHSFMHLVIHAWLGRHAWEGISL